MLVLSRMLNEEIVIGNVRIRVLEIRGNRVRIGITAPQDCQVLRGELLERNDENNPIHPIG